jgi:hypothetical protein
VATVARFLAALRATEARAARSLEDRADDGQVVAEHVHRAAQPEPLDADLVAGLESHFAPPLAMKSAIAASLTNV